MSGVGWNILAMSGVGITPFMGPDYVQWSALILTVNVIYHCQNIPMGATLIWRDEFFLGILKSGQWTLCAVCTERWFQAFESCPHKEALHENTGNNWTDSCSESGTSSHVTIIPVACELLLFCFQSMHQSNYFRCFHADFPQKEPLSKAWKCLLLHTRLKTMATSNKYANQYFQCRELPITFHDIKVNLYSLLTINQPIPFPPPSPF